MKEPKTEAGLRGIALPSVAVEALRLRWEEQQLQKLAIGPAWQDSGYVLTMPDGRPVRLEYPTKVFIELIRRAGLPALRLHDLRHSHASQMLKNGVSLTAVSARLGHSNPAITARIYAHLLKGMDETTALTVDRAMRAAIEKDAA